MRKFICPYLHFSGIEGGSTIQKTGNNIRMTSIRPMTQPSSKTLPTLEMNYFLQTTTHHRKSSQHVDSSHKKPSQHQTRSVIDMLFLQFTVYRGKNWSVKLL